MINCDCCGTDGSGDGSAVTDGTHIIIWNIKALIIIKMIIRTTDSYGLYLSF